MFKYFGVIYFKDGFIGMCPGDSQAECLEELKKAVSKEKFKNRVLSTTVIKRNMDNFKDGKIFGCPKSLNVVK